MLDAILTDGTLLSFNYATKAQRAHADAKIAALRKIGVLDACYVVSEYI